MIAELRFTQVFHRLVAAAQSNRYLILYGGSSSSKSHSILQYLYLYALKYPNVRITIGAESVPVIKKTVLADMRDHVMQESWDERKFNKSELVYSLPNKSIIQFVPGDDYYRWKGMRQHITYFDEVNHIPEEVYKQADIRTEDKVISSFNPTARFWLADSFENANTYVDHSTYLDNPYLSSTIVDALKSRMETDKNFTDVYLYGKWGSLEGLIYEEGVNWVIAGSFPTKYEDRILGLDFGFTHPSALLDVRLKNGELWVKERLYQSGLSYPEIASHLDYLTIADSADPRGIGELQKLGKNVQPVKKGPDSVINGIRLVKQYKMNIHNSSTNLIKELRNYKWDEDKDGKTLEKPVKAFDDAVDALRYAVDGMMNQRNFFVV